MNTTKKKRGHGEQTTTPRLGIEVGASEVFFLFSFLLEGVLVKVLKWIKVWDFKYKYPL